MTTVTISRWFIEKIILFGSTYYYHKFSGSFVCYLESSSHSRNWTNKPAMRCSTIVNCLLNKNALLNSDGFSTTNSNIWHAWHLPHRRWCE